MRERNDDYIMHSRTLAKQEIERLRIIAADIERVRLEKIVEDARLKLIAESK